MPQSFLGKSWYTVDGFASTPRDFQLPIDASAFANLPMYNLNSGQIKYPWLTEVQEPLLKARLESHIQLVWSYVVHHRIVNPNHHKQSHCFVGSTSSMPMFTVSVNSQTARLCQNLGKSIRACRNFVRLPASWLFYLPLKDPTNLGLVGNGGQQTSLIPREEDHEVRVCVWVGVGNGLGAPCRDYQQPHVAGKLYNHVLLIMENPRKCS